MGIPDHVVEQGECLSSIAEKSGHFWEKVWYHPRNVELRELRKDPNILLPGDLLFVPPIELRFESAATDQIHCFQRKGVPAKLQLQFCVEDKPRGGERYAITISDGKVLEGTLDAEGRLEQPISPHAQWARVVVGVGAAISTYFLDLGHMDPITDLNGVQKRLLNLGYLPQMEDPPGEATRQAIIAFQHSRKLPETGTMNERTCAALEGAHGS